ncbi:metal ABC transporter permease [Tepidiphilus margaritifer]|uniref:metal ABC transporter permease n=1 Tax=Tepidiphilus margaritifer TaxID=203471 RepID=UPI000425B75E|nr:metal ABC transporter permease [Tepidiphilus margaritifer]
MTLPQLLTPFADYDFMRRALAGALMLTLGATPVGVFLMLRRMSLMADAMSHAVLPGVAAAYFFSGLSLGAMTLGGLTAGVLVAIATGWAARHSVLFEDTAMGTFQILSLTAGILLMTAHGRPVDVLQLLFGSILAIDRDTLALIALVASTTLVLLALGWRILVLECFDAPFLRRHSPRLSALAHYGFLVLVVLNLVAAFHAIGTLLAISVLILPAATARLWVNGLGKALVLAAGCGALGSYLGLVASFRWDLPAGPAIALALALPYLVSLFLAPHGFLRQRHPRKRHLEN